MLLAVQVAAQQGKYLAKLLATGHASPGRPIAPEARPFKYGHKGSLAYVGGDKAVMDVPGLQPITGFAAGDACSLLLAQQDCHCQLAAASRRTMTVPLCMFLRGLMCAELLCRFCLHGHRMMDSTGGVLCWGAGLLWKGFETYSQISLRNMLLVSGDWVRAKLFGRDISRV